MKVVAVILIAGKGERFGGDKTAMSLGGKPVWRWSYETFLKHHEVDGVGIVGAMEACADLCELAPEAVFVVPGGPTRKESSRRALEALPPDADLVLIHDGARPFVSAEVISDVIEAAARVGAAAPGVVPTDTIKRIGEGQIETLDRGQLRAVQTPQGLKAAVFRAGHELLEDATDDLALAEAAGITPEIVQGDRNNFKITVPADLERAKALIGSGEARTGIGYDIHRFSEDKSRTLMLGGIAFPGHPALDGHSDADVLLHAIVDALLGAAALGDIGQHFPNTDPRWSGEPSMTFLRHAANLLTEERWEVRNVDATLIAETPKLLPAIPSMRGAIAGGLGIEPERVSLKATTNERLGAVGRSEGIAAMAVSMIVRR
ncbi:MAG: 2-C-methyl-D-erythritol 2,4-cyclodiphosphate synthase [Armatimonadetes bacterium]|nr:2-C-methyl-D-erythritol 2,4-cyclodiphosphate synthase [Armatimonadota bacterium]